MHVLTSFTWIDRLRMLTRLMV